MLQFMGSQRAGHDGATEQQQCAAGRLRKIRWSLEIFIAGFGTWIKVRDEVCLLFRDVLCRRRRKRKMFPVF